VIDLVCLEDMKLNTLIGVFLVVAVGAAFASFVWSRFMSSDAASVEDTMCTMDARECPDGSYVGRTGPNCEFICPPSPTLSEELAAHIAAKSDLVTLTTPVPLGLVASPLTISGEARGPWFFEGSFPVSLTNWDGLIIAEGYVTAEGEWMTEEFVPFYGTLEFVSPYNEGDPHFMKSGSLILQKDNPSGLPEHDDALEIPVRFAP